METEPQQREIDVGTPEGALQFLDHLSSQTSGKRDVHIAASTSIATLQKVIEEWRVLRAEAQGGKVIIPITGDPGDSEVREPDGE